MGGRRAGGGSTVGKGEAVRHDVVRGAGDLAAGPEGGADAGHVAGGAGRRKVGLEHAAAVDDGVAGRDVRWRCLPRRAPSRGGAGGRRGGRAAGGAEAVAAHVDGGRWVVRRCWEASGAESAARAHGSGCVFSETFNPPEGDGLPPLTCARNRVQSEGKFSDLEQQAMVWASFFTSLRHSEIW
jgi:hypothetical protein